MMAVIALVAGVVALIAVLRLFEIERRAGSAIQIAHEALGTITDPDLSDEIKERQVRRATFTLVKSSATLLAIAAAGFLAAAGFVVGGDLLGLFSIGEAMDIALSWSFILWSSLGSIALWIGIGRLRGKDAGAAAGDTTRDEVPYSALDRALHNLAFSSPGLQKGLARVEDRLWRRRIEDTRAERPVLVTSLPRAGTTILLELLARQPEFASASYRNMPFTLSPLLWGRFSNLFRKAGEKAERAHGDGIDVDFDSPEAFEEMVWMAFWRDRYRGGRIALWNETDRNAEFEAFLSRHMRKIVAGKPGAFRYVSKNNANIARLPLLTAAFPDARLVIPVRDPAAQVVSLMRQHERFADLHARDRFARQYMEGIGHYEFGAALRPIAFPGAPESAAGAGTSDYWLRYWNAAYAHVLEHAPGDAVFIDHAALSSHPQEQLPRLAEALELRDGQALLSASGMFRPSKPPPELSGASAGLLHRAKELHAALLERAL
ncbi:sulfotransferase family protein [Paracoccus methylarcula]|uniref:Sulfotransferase n=1 Tax=Paracoccus methylarcula TaxID=72022 RepID=A0A3R7LGK1_9RHOB|nr:sulfotransferase [Paracoccus methylarcula]RNF33238.1 sulfotransferase [Paracoccus methylarcula]